jgi:hypothetical protein
MSLAFGYFPAQYVCLASAAWLILLRPGTVEIHRQFQNQAQPYQMNQ